MRSGNNSIQYSQNILIELHFYILSATLFIERGVNMYTNIDKKHLLELCQREPEAQLVVDTMMENHKKILGTMSHEIGNPLTYLYSSSQIIEEDLPELKHHKHWIAHKEELAYMKDLLLQLSSYNNGSRLQMEAVDICQLLRTTVLAFASACAEEEVEIVSNIPAMPMITIDKLKIKQVINNLLKNAKEACAPGGQVRLSATQDQDFISISIKDNGCGIPEDTLAHIFTPFKTFKQGGTGLGLAITHEIIDAHEGTIHVSSTEGIGTEFIITIPID